MTDDRRISEDLTPQSGVGGLDIDDDVAKAPDVAGGEVATEDAAAAGAKDDGTAKLRAEYDALNDRYLRLAAEFDNFRKRSARESVEVGTRAQAELVTALLEVLDDLQRVTVLQESQATADSLLEGIRLVEKKFRTVLESAGLEAIEADGAVFDPLHMEALMTVPADRPEEDDLVADVFQKGYRFREILIRPARVRVKKYEPDA